MHQAEGVASDWSRHPPFSLRKCEGEQAKFVWKKRGGEGSGRGEKGCRGGGKGKAGEDKGMRGEKGREWEERRGGEGEDGRKGNAGAPSKTSHRVRRGRSGTYD